MGAVYHDFVKMEPEQLSVIVVSAQIRKRKKREPRRDNTGRHERKSVD